MITVAHEAVDEMIGIIAGDEDLALGNTELSEGDVQDVAR